MISYMEKPKMPNLIKKRGDARRWQKKYDAQAPRIGDLAPDFELYDVHGETAVRLSQLVGPKPIALIFGSFT